MNSSKPSKPPAPLPQHNGWTPERQQRFLDHLADVGSIAAAARAVGMTRQSAYWLRRQDHAADFRRRWDEALADSGAFIEALAMDRLVDGEEEVIERDGETVAVRRRPCDARLLLFYLKRLEDRRSARAALERAVVLRRLDRQAASASNGYNPPDAEKLSIGRDALRKELMALHKQYGVGNDG
jgi:hypothetical protein